ncbi:response regulator [Terrihabitans rhizophilus]|uniref:Response regulator n=1 Tax=Terrihabitans rhizophilus TaxID=3092662 RepID=A0ABU4RMG9_9HYPH|nr:response regulator [Terrihabitans sp. PJ23]MDX6805299.1 response regulator [Terrihabitans sp. PJ23]
MRTILVVDDEFGVADVLAAALEDEGYRVNTAANGREALTRLGEEVPDLVISDFMMPVMDGPAMAHAIREAGHADLPIIMMSAMPEAAVRQRFDGYFGFLRKPFRIHVAADLVARALGEQPNPFT